jgi:ABC-type iron transport system FetAB ATPase subunit
MADPAPPAPETPPTPRLTLKALKSPLAGPFTLELAAGGCAAISGHSGSGKSLFLRMIADLDPNTGEVRLDGAARASLAAPAWRRRVPYVAADSGWWRDRVADHFTPDQLTPARALAGRLDLPPELIDGPVQRLSTGERQRLAIIRALVLDSPVLLLDEPTGPLDPDSTAKMEMILKERLQGGTTILLVTHDQAQGERLGARRFVMRERRLEPAA